MAPNPLRREGGSGVIFACLAHMKVLFIADQPLFTELRYLYSFWSYRILKFGRRASLYGNMKGQKWPKLSFFSLDFFIFNLSISQIGLKWSNSISFSNKKCFWSKDYQNLKNFEVLRSNFAIFHKNAIFSKSRKTLRLLQKTC